VNDLALRAQVLQGYEEFKVRAVRSSLSVYATPAGQRFIYDPSFCVAYPWIFHVHSGPTGTAGAGASAGEVLHGVVMEVGYRGRFGIRELCRCVRLCLSPSPSAFTALI
jgi:hypothetical protein